MPPRSLIGRAHRMQHEEFSSRTKVELCLFLQVQAKLLIAAAFSPFLTETIYLIPSSSSFLLFFISSLNSHFHHHSPPHNCTPQPQRPIKHNQQDILPTGHFPPIKILQGSLQYLPPMGRPGRTGSRCQGHHGNPHRYP